MIRPVRCLSLLLRKNRKISREESYLPKLLVIFIYYSKCTSTLWVFCVKFIISSTFFTLHIVSIQRHTRIDSGIICIIDRRFIIRHDFDLYRSFQQKKRRRNSSAVCVCVVVVIYVYKGGLHTHTHTYHGRDYRGKQEKKRHN